VVLEIAITAGADAVHRSRTFRAVDGERRDASAGGEPHGWIERKTKSGNGPCSDLAALIRRDVEMISCDGRHSREFQFFMGGKGIDCSTA
jgi:hypothetical protein